MKLKNNALQELYDTLVNGTISFSPYVESPVAKAFRECDEKLQKDIDIRRRSNEVLLSANLDLASNKRKLEKERDDLLIRAHNAEDAAEELKKECKTLHDHNDILEKEKKLLTDSCNGWSKIAIENRKQIIELQKELKDLQIRNDILEKNYDTAVSAVEEAINENDELTKNYQELSIKLKRIQIDVGRESRFLWDMLQNVRDVKPEEFDCECETLGDILDMDLEDFLDAYEKWQEQKENDRMRKRCKECPLARGCGRYTLKNATYYFDNKPVTMTGTVEINTDVLRVITGSKDD